MEKITFYTCLCFLSPILTLAQVGDHTGNQHPGLVLFELGLKESFVDNARDNSWLRQYGYHPNASQRTDMELSIGCMVHKTGEFLLGFQGSILKQGEESWGGFISYGYPLAVAKRITILPGMAAGLGSSSISPANVPDSYKSHIPAGTSKLRIVQSYQFFSPALKTGIELGKDPNRGFGIFFKVGYDIFSWGDWKLDNIEGTPKYPKFKFLYKPTDILNLGTKGWFMTVSVHVRANPAKPKH